MISPTLACVNYLHIDKDIRELDKGGVDFFHIDIMDGHYVPNLCINFDFIKAVRSISDTQMDVHLMVSNPFDYLDNLATEGVSYISAHINLLRDESSKFIEEVHKRNIKVGLAISPEDDIKQILPYIDKLDLVLLMFVKPGFAGQKFMPDILSKVEYLNNLRLANGLDFIIEADGGVGWDNVDILAKKGVDLCVAGVFAVFGQDEGIEKSVVAFRKRAKSLYYGL